MANSKVKPHMTSAVNPYPNPEPLLVCVPQENARRQAEQDEPGEDGRPKKRGRGRPLGSKTKPRPEDELGPADTVEVSRHGLHCTLVS